MSSLYSFSIIVGTSILSPFGLFLFSGQGIDQLRHCIETIKSNPMDRRIILNSWNPKDVNEMALPPCHMFSQFFVTDEMRLSCLMYQRSCDMGLGNMGLGNMGLGNPNILLHYGHCSSFSTRSPIQHRKLFFTMSDCRTSKILYIILYLMDMAFYYCWTFSILISSQICGLQPGEFIHVLGNAHVYLNHIEPLKVTLRYLLRCDNRPQSCMYESIDHHHAYMYSS